MLYKSGKLLASMLLAFTLSFQAAAQDQATLTTLHDNLVALNTALSDADARQQPVAALLRDFDIQLGGALDENQAAAQNATRPTVLMGNRSAQRMDVRLVLSLLIKKFGGKDNFDIENVQGEPIPHAMLLRGGSFTLADLPAMFEEAGYPVDSYDADGVLHVPLIIWNDASLTIETGEAVTLRRDTGAYILNFGLLETTGAKIEATELQSPFNNDFRPFVTTLGGGVLRAQDSHFINLGFGTTPKYSGVSVLGTEVGMQLNRSFLQGNVFDQGHGVSIVSTDSIDIRHNKFIDMRSNALLVKESMDVLIYGNLFFGEAQTNSLRLDRDSTRARIIGNVILGGDRAGMSVQGGVQQLTISNNIIWQRGGSGINLRMVECAIVTDNVLMDNAQKGIEIREGNNIVLRNNVLAQNQNAGVWISEQEPQARTSVFENLFVENRSGISGATAEMIIMQGNDLTRQRPRLLDGDITFQSRALVQDLLGAERIALTSAGVDTVFPAASDTGCPLVAEDQQ